MSNLDLTQSTPDFWDVYNLPKVLLYLSRVMIKRTTIKSSIPVVYLKEGAAFICYSRAFDLVAHGDSFEDTEKSFTTTLQLFIEEVTRKGSWEEVLKEYGWTKVKQEWDPPQIIGQRTRPIEIPALN